MVCDILNLIDSTIKNTINLDKKNIYNHPPHLKPYFMGRGLVHETSHRQLVSSSSNIFMKSSKDGLGHAGRG